MIIITVIQDIIHAILYNFEKFTFSYYFISSFHLEFLVAEQSVNLVIFYGMSSYTFFEKI